MTYFRETLIVKRETSLGTAIAREASFVKRLSFRSLNVSRVTFYEQRDYSQAGR
ncbi:MAG: hypothetical protein ABIQ24_05950 [Nitrospiraceae bacterium]